MEAIPVRREGGLSFLIRDPWGVAPEVMLSEKAFFLASLLDGNNTLRDLQAEFMRRYGELLFMEDLQRIIDYLDENFLLESPRLQRRMQEIRKEWEEAPLREPAFSGRAYPEDPHRLRERLKGFLEPDRRPVDGPIRGLVAPHIDLGRGGDCYGVAYSSLKGLEPPELVVILGTCHVPMEGPFALTDKDFLTPFGVVSTDREAVRALRERLPFDPLGESILHRREHTIEFQLLFLQLLWDSAFKILPILCRSFTRYLKGESPEEDGDFSAFIRALRETFQGYRALLVMSADLAHIGPQFGDPYPVDHGELMVVEQKDREMLSRVESGDARGFLEYIRAEGDRRRICGLPPIYAGLKVLEPTRGLLLDYRKWRDPQGLGAVTFCSLLFLGES